MLSSFSAQSFKSFGQFRALGSRFFSVTAMLKNVDFSGKTNTAIHGLREDVTASRPLVVRQPRAAKVMKK